MKLRTRFGLLFTVLIITFSAIAIFTYFSLRKINNLTEIDKKVHHLFRLSLELRKNESDYFNWDLKNPSYFNTGKSQFSNLSKTNFELSQKYIKQLLQSDFTNRNNLKLSLTKIQSMVIDYQNIFSIIQKNKFELGFEEKGIIGQMNISAKNIEREIEKQNNKTLRIQLLMLKQYEKDYLLKRNTSSKEQFDRELFKMFKTIDSNVYNKNQSEIILKALKFYGETFSNFVDKDLYIGYWKDEGLMASLELKGNNMNEAIASLSQLISEKTTHYINLTTFILLTFIAICAVLALLIGFYIFQRIFKLMGSEPEEVAKIAKNIAKGDLRFDLADSSKCHGLMKSVLVMAENLKRIISGIYYNSYQIVSASQQFSETSVTISQVAISQASYIEDISSKIKEIGNNTSFNANSALQTEKIAALAKDEIHKIKEQTETSLLTSQTISQKVAIIDHISTQTKILALNAAVEAAHAGKFGSAFQVIAEEVKRLADVSKDAAVEINKLTEKNLLQSKEVTQLVFKILPLIENTSELIKNIALSSHEQDLNLQHVTSTIDHLSESSNENAAASEEMAASTEELEKQILSLKMMVSYFKVDNTVSKGENYAHATFQNGKEKKVKKKMRKLWKKKFNLKSVS